MASPQSSSLKRSLVQPSTGDDNAEAKKARCSQRTHIESVTSKDIGEGREGARTPPGQMEPSQGLSPEFDTQPFSQFVYPPQGSYEVEDEDAEGVWGYLVSSDPRFGEPLVLKKRATCPKALKRGTGDKKVSKDMFLLQEEEYENEKQKAVSSGGYLVGRHPECDRILPIPTVSNRHCLFFNEYKAGEPIAVLEDLSSNGTFVNGSMLGRNNRKQLEDGDEISILDQFCFTFHYPRNRSSSPFHQQYTIQDLLGKGHFASVYLCVSKANGAKFAVKKFERRSGERAKSQIDGLQQEIAILMSVSHPGLLCLKDTFDEEDGVYLVLELAAEGELFNCIAMRTKLSEDETRKVFIQLFQAVKYLHDRNIIHRDIKPENILIIDKELTVKLADFGLAKVIGEESFTTTLCGTPSYVAPEILKLDNHRRYTRAVDIWSLGVVLYICLCGFPPFSDELYSKDNPYTLAEQILTGRFDFPSPYWDSIDDIALDLIERMLEVDVEKRFTIEECLQHPWLTQASMEEVAQRSMDSTDRLIGQMQELDFSRRKPKRERTLLAEINDVRIEKVIQNQENDDQLPIKVFKKNRVTPKARKDITNEQNPAEKRAVEEFINMGGNGDEVLFADGDGVSGYEPEDLAAKKVPRTM